jgi:hypothetical protein
MTEGFRTEAILDEEVLGKLRVIDAFFGEMSAQGNADRWVVLGLKAGDHLRGDGGPHLAPSRVGRQRLPGPPAA